MIQVTVNRGIEAHSYSMLKYSRCAWSIVGHKTGHVWLISGYGLIVEVKDEIIYCPKSA